MRTNIKKTFFVATVLFASAFIFTQCNSDDEFESNKKVSIKIDLGGELTQCIPACLVVDENNPSNKYIRIDSVIAYGLGMEFFLPDSLKDNDLKIIATGKMRESESFKGAIAFNLFNNRDSMLVWSIIKSETHVRHLNSWIPFKDSISISKQVNNMSAKSLRMFPYKNSGKGTFDVDDLVIEIIRE